MILQALAEYYKRQSKIADSGIAPIGLENREFKFIIEIDTEGNFLNLIDTRDGGKKGKSYLAPKTVGRSGRNAWQVANLLGDTYEYVLGESDDEHAADRRDFFVARIKELPDKVKHFRGVTAVLKFYEKEEWKKVILHHEWENCRKIAGCNLSFKLDEDTGLVSEAQEFVEWIAASAFPDDEQDSSKEYGRCLVTGKVAAIKRTHSKFSFGKQQAALVGFQKNSGYDSYGKEQGYNAPVSEYAEFCYSTALKTLLASQDNRVVLGNITLLFWAVPSKMSREDAVAAEQTLSNLFVQQWSNQTQAEVDNANRGVKNAKDIFESISTGKIPVDSGDRFYLLGITPNVARISVVFWKNGTIKEIADNILSHFEDNKINRTKQQRQATVLDILASSALDYKIAKVPSNMIPALIYAIINGTVYPTSLFQHIIERIRADQALTPVRVGFIKAYLNRKNRMSIVKGDELTVSLNREYTDIAYRLGRLFAVLEKVQEEANPGINTTIVDRFYSSFSSNPSVTFPTLMRLEKHHLAKLNPGRKTQFEKEVKDIISAFQEKGVPNFMPIEDQGRFAIGYYHERDYIFATGLKENKEESNKGGN